MMLRQPPSNESFRLIGIDPGTHSMGVSFLEWDLSSPFFIIKNAITITPHRYGFETTVELYGDRTARIQSLGQSLTQLIQQYQPHAVISETPYMGRYVTSYESGIETLIMIRQVVERYTPYSPLYTVDPTTVKQSAGVDMKQFRRLKRDEDKKECVKIALLNRSDLRWDVDPHVLDEHSIDAVAVSLHYLLFII